MAIINPTTALIFLSAILGEDGTSSAFAPSTSLTSKQDIHSSSTFPLRISSSSFSPESNTASGAAADFNWDAAFNPTEIDSGNTPPSLQRILTSLTELKSGSDLRGTFVPHQSSGSTIANVSLIVKRFTAEHGNSAAFTPFAAHCYGVAFARWLLKTQEGIPTICIGRDPRLHGERLADAFARGAESVDGVTGPVRVVYTGVTNTPSMNEFVRAGKCDAAVMITASHLPEDKNGVKFFSKNGGLSTSNIDELIVFAKEEASSWYDMGILPPSSGVNGVMCSELVDFIPYYKDTLKQAILREVPSSTSKPLSNINIVVNPGNGAGYFFNDLLRDLGANVAGSIHLTPNGEFPDTFGVPNPEKKEMVEETMRACKASNADIGIMFDTDADRAGFVLPRSIEKNGKRSEYEALNGNRLIALLSTIFSTSAPGCTIVTDSTTSEGLGKFLEDKLGLHHFRFLRGYANVIGKAKELTESGNANAEVAIETSGHCAMKENGYVDDGTYTAVKIIGLLARTAASQEGSLLDLISDLDEMPFEEEFRVKITDGSLDTTTSLFQEISQSLKEKCDIMDDWSLDVENMEGVRVRLSTGGFFMIRQSLHDPVISMQVESISQQEAQEKVLKPLLGLLSKHSALDYSALE